MRTSTAIVAASLLLAACGGGEPGAGPPSTIDDRIPIVIGLPPTPDPGSPGIDPDGAVNLAPLYVNDIDVELLGNGQGRFTLKGDLPTPCHQPRIETLVSFGAFVVDLEVWSQSNLDTVCVQVLEPFVATKDFAGLRAGTYSLRTGGKEFMSLHVPASLAEAGDDDGDGRVEVPVVEPFEGLFPVTDRSAYDRLASEVEAGHQPWTLDPIETARAFLSAAFGSSPATLDFNQLEGLFGEVVWSGGRVVLAQPAANGPWVVTGLESSSFDVSISDYDGETVWVGINAHEAGSLSVKGGAFASEWADAHEQDVLPGDLVEVELRLGATDAAGPERILIHIELERPAGEGSAIAQFGVSRTTIVYGD